MEDFEKTMRVGWGLANSTIGGRMRCARRLVNFLDGHPLEVDKTDILDFLEEYDAQGVYKGIRVIYGRFFDTELASDIKIPTFDSVNNSIPDKDKIRETFYSLEDLDYRTAYLMWASSGLRRGELLEMNMGDIDEKKRMLTPNHNTSTKRSFISFYNEEAERLFDKLGHVPNKDPDSYTRKFKKASEGKISLKFCVNGLQKRGGARELVANTQMLFAVGFQRLLEQNTILISVLGGWKRFTRKRI